MIRHLAQVAFLFAASAALLPRPERSAPSSGAFPGWPETFEGKPLFETPLTDISRQVGTVFQDVDSKIISPIVEDELLYGLLKNVAAILSPRDGFVVLNLYSNGYSALLGETLVREAFQGQLREMTSGELVLTDGFGKALPLSIYVRIKR